MGQMCVCLCCILCTRQATHRKLRVVHMMYYTGVFCTANQVKGASILRWVYMMVHVWGGCIQLCLGVRFMYSLPAFGQWSLSPLVLADRGYGANNLQL